MEKIKLAIIYYSATGTNYQLAKWAEEGAKEIGAEVRVLKVQELAPQKAIESNPVWKSHIEATKDIAVASTDDIVWADAVIMSSPTRFGNVAAQMKQFMDLLGGLWAQGKLTNKVVSAMSSAQNTHGGQEATIQAIYTSAMHWGAIIVPPGFTDASIFKAGGSPYGICVTIDGEGKIIGDVKDAIKHQAKRTVMVAEWIKKGSQ
jgi:NAD(P)H dehydrogenase (quinone)